MVEDWLGTVQTLLEPKAVFGRFAYHLEPVYPRRIPWPASPARLNLANVKKGLCILARVLWQIGVRCDVCARRRGEVLFRRPAPEPALP